ncbi:MAG: tetratricopeptide repeat protein, partial [Syntrophobacteraceae bacterium]|nr:tetratricopeptide repeat protein [Syntrophobacteraceae bacterium]
KLVSWKSLSSQQKCEACAPCHGKIRSLTNSFSPGDRFFDHYDLVLLEDPDFHPDGRDRSENHTYVRWLMNPCAKSGKLDCLHCHEPGGQFRFQGQERANEACRPCHEDRVQNARSHTNHPEGSEGNRCIACHMPKSQSGAVWRSDHSMLPPTPAATMAFQSPNACNLCHQDRDGAWADGWVRKRKTRDYQASTLHRARLVDEARRKDWSRLDDMLQFIAGKDREDITAASLIRLLTLCDDERKWPVLAGALRDGSPLIRASAAQGLAGNFSPDVLKELLAATEDEYRVVRVRAAMALSGYPRTMLSEEDFQILDKATGEFVASLKIHPDDWESHYNMGNYLLNRGHLPAALVAYNTAARLDPRRVLPLLNASIAAARLADMLKAEELLQRALEIEPNSPAVNFHMALLRADQGDMPQAEKHLRATLKADPQMAEAACNLCVLLSKDRFEEAVQWCRKAYELDPSDGKYAYTLAFFERKGGKTEEAIRILREALGREASNTEAVLLLAEIYEEQGLKAEAKELVVGALSNEALSSRDRYRLFLKLQEIEPASPSGEKAPLEDQSLNRMTSPEREVDI